jgi:hypothetical protein
MIKIQRNSDATGPISPSAVPASARRLPPLSWARLMPPMPKATAANPIGSPKTNQPNWGMPRLTRVALTPNRKAVLARPLSDVRVPPRRFTSYIGGTT